MFCPILYSLIPGGPKNGTPWLCLYAPVVLKVCALLCHLAVEHVDDADSNGVGQGGHEPQVVGTVPSKQASLKTMQRNHFAMAGYPYCNSSIPQSKPQRGGGGGGGGGGELGMRLDQG